MIKNLIAERIFEPLYYNFYGGFDGVRFKHYLQKAQWNSLEKNSEIQKELLYELLKHASTKIPHYKRLFEDKKIKLTRKDPIKALKQLPILTKEDVKKDFNKMYLIKPGSKWYYSNSGGSTGKPVKLIQDNIFKMKMLVVKDWQKEWAGIRPGDQSIKLWGSEADINHEKESTLKRAANWMRSIHLMNSFVMDDTNMGQYVREINRIKPKFILAYARAMNELAKFVLRNKIKVVPPKAIMTSAGILYPEFKKNIEKAFKCPVFNRYGSREVGDIACDCEKHEGLHISMFNHYVEILNDKLKPCKEGESGDIYITLLTNYTMPLIRYKIGDVGTYTEKKCSCGRGLPMIKRIVGRDLDNFITADNRIIHGGLFVHFIGVVFNNESIEQFQVIQKSVNLIEIKVVLTDKRKFEQKKGEIDEFIHKIMGEKCIVKWVPVKKIEASKSGKYRYTKREFR